MVGSIKKSKWITTTVLLMAGLLFAAPVAFTLLPSLHFGGAFPTVRQYGELLITNYSFLRFFWNSSFYAVSITLLCVLISFPLGFLFAKVRFPGRDALFFIYLIVMLLPFQATLLPNYIQLNTFGLLNTPLALALPLLFSPFAVFMLRQFMKNVPEELLEYTLMESSSLAALFRYAVWPEVKPAVTALAIIVFCESWNMVEPALIFAAENPGIRPLSVMLSQLPEDVSFSAATVYMYPIIIIFILFKETIQSSMSSFHWD